MAGPSPRSSSVWLVGLGVVGAACGPAGPQTPGETDAATGEDPVTGTSSSPTGDPTTDGPTTTATGTTSSPDCRVDADCDGLCPVCQGGVCEEDVGCCYYGAEPSPEAPGWRCLPPPIECYDDADCGPDYDCVRGECILPGSQMLPACPAAAVDLREWNLGESPSAFVLADFDGDLDLDLAAAEPAVAQIEVALNDGAGEFVLAGAFGLGPAGDGLSLAGGDLDGDGDPDLVAARVAEPGALILLFGQDAVFTPPVERPTADRPYRLWVADVDGDGAQDVVALSPSGVAVHLGDGQGALADAVLSPIGEIGDTATLAGPAGAVRLFGAAVGGTAGGVFAAGPTGEFTPIRDLEFGAPFAGVLAADLGMSGAAAVVAVHPLVDSGVARIWPPVGPDAWADASVRLETASPLYGGLFAEFEDPPGPDLVAATGTDQVAVLVGDGAGGFACERVLPAHTDVTPRLLAVGDVDGDGDLDVIVGDDDHFVVGTVFRM